MSASWQEITLGELLSDASVFVDGDWVESKDQDPSGDVRLIQLADVGDGVYIDKSARFLTSAKAKDLRCTFLRPGDVLIARMPDPLGRACIFPGDLKPAVTVVDVCIVRPNPGRVDSRWLMHTVNSNAFRRTLSGFISGTTRQRISRGNLAKLRINVPPLVEQRRIAAILDNVDALRAKRREAIAKLDQLLQSVFLDMFGDPVKNPKGLEMVALGGLINLRTGKLDANASSEDGEYPFFTCARKPLRIATYSYDCECVLVAGNGDLNVKKYAGKFDAYQRTYILESVDKKRLTTNYLFHFLDAYLDELRQQSIGGIIKYIKKGNLTEAMIPLSDPKTQINFNRISDEVSLHRRRLEAGHIAAQHLFDVIQSKALAGTL